MPIFKDKLKLQKQPKKVQQEATEPAGNMGRAGNGFSLSVLDLQAIRKLLEVETGGSTCPSCQMPFDKGKKRKLIDTCGHERCYSCLFRNEPCPLCVSKCQETNRDNGVKDRRQYEYGELSANQDHRQGANSCGFNSPDAQLRNELSSPDIAASSSTPSSRPPRHPKVDPADEGASSRGFSDFPACATPPQHRRRMYYPKALRIPFGSRRSCNSVSPADNAGTLSDTPPMVVTRRNIQKAEKKLHHRISLGATPAAYAGHLSSVVFGKIKSLWTVQSSTANSGLNQLATDDEGGNVKPIPLAGKTKSSQDELRVRLGLFLENNTRRNMRSTPVQSCSSLASVNTSPVSTLTGSSEADMSHVLQESSAYTTGCDSIGSMMSVSISGHSNASSSPLSRRHSVTTAQPGQIDDLSIFKNRKTHIRRSARSATGNDHREYKAQLEQYRSVQLTLKPQFFEVPQQEPDPIFVGRHWLLRELSNIFQSTETSSVLIAGQPGTGKTSIVLQLVEHSCFGRKFNAALNTSEGIYCQINVAHDRIRALAAHVVGYHFCQADNNTTCLVPDFIHSIAAQLCQAPQLAAYRDNLLNEPHLQHILSVKECIANPERAMIIGILEPLTNLRRTGKLSTKSCIILIDALSEAEYHRPDHGDTIASFLAKMSEHFPPWLKVVATVRTQMLEFIKGLSYTKISLDNTANEGIQKDILEYITIRLNQSAIIQSNASGGGKESTSGQKFAQHLLNLSNGSFLFVKLSLDLLEKGHLVIKSNSYKVLPVTLAQIYLLHFNLRFSTSTAFDKVVDILNVCLSAVSPLTLTEIFYSVNSLHTENLITWNEFIARFKHLAGCLIKRIDNTFMFFHPTFREWLQRREPGESSKFLCDLRIGHTGIAFRLSRLQVPLDPELTLELGHHILKAHIYRNATQVLSPRDLQSYWVASVADSTSEALCTLRNVYSPNIKVSRLLLLAGASPDHVTSFMGNSPILCIASHDGIVPMVSLLLEFGADVEKSNSQGSTPLILAATKGHCDVVRQLVAAGASLGHTDTAHRCALVHAARAGKANIVKYIIACDWNARPKSSDISREDAAQQAVVAAAVQGNTSIVEDILDMSEVNVNSSDTLTGETALTAASKNGRTETVNALLSRGASIDTRNRRSMSALSLAVKDGHWAVAERLLQQQADVEQTDGVGKTPLIIAAEEGHIGIIELLLSHGASLIAKDHEGLTALSWTCLRGRLQAAKCLLEHGADQNHTDNTGRTPLDLAAYQGSAMLVQLLLDKGAKIEHVDVSGMRPLDRAISCRNIQAVHVFLKRGAKLGPATWAMATGKPEILLLLLNKLLEDGNILYRKNRMQEASHRYQYALRKFPGVEQYSEHRETFNQLKVNFLLNYSRCKRKMNEIAEAIDLASQAIQLRPNSYEGFYARAKANFEYGHLNKALTDTQLAIQKSVNSSQEIRNVLGRLREDIFHAQSNNQRSTPVDANTTITDL